MRATTLGAMLTAAGLLVATRAEANPVMANICHDSDVSNQTVVVDFELSHYSPASLDVYRIAGNEQVLVATATWLDGEPSSADLGSGVESTRRFHIEDTCVPLGDWTYQALDADQDPWCSWSAPVNSEDPACMVDAENADDADDSSCAVRHLSRKQQAPRSVWLVLVAAVGWVARRRRT